MPLEFTIREEIAAPPDRVFAALSNVDQFEKWMPNLLQLEKLSPGEVGRGTTFRETRKVFGREASEHFEITEFEPNSRLDLFVDGTKGSSKRGEYRFRYTLEPKNGGTVMTLAGEIGGIGKVMALIGRVFMGPFKKAIAKDMTAMKRYLET